MSNVTDLAERVINAGLVDEARAVIDLLQSTDDAGRAAIAKAAGGVAGRTVDPATGEITEPDTRVTTAEPPEPGQLPEAVLDSFRQFYGAGSKHQWVDFCLEMPYSKGADKKANGPDACNARAALSIGLVGQPEPDAILPGFPRRVQPFQVDAPFRV